MEAERIGRDKGLQRVRLMIAESYEDLYARELRRSPHPAAP